MKYTNDFRINSSIQLTTFIEFYHRFCVFLDFSNAFDIVFMSLHINKILRYKLYV